MKYYEPSVTYNVNIYRRKGKVHLVNCWQGDLHRTPPPGCIGAARWARPVRDEAES
jgi:hypothetical protein